jgi:hypothetical protein
MPGLSRDEKRRELERGAYRHYGRKYAGWIVFGPWVAKAALWVGLIALAYLGWEKIPHWVLGTVALTLAASGAAALIVPRLPSLSARRRMIDRAVGASRGRVQLGWAYTTLLVVGSGMAWLALWSPFS